MWCAMCAKQECTKALCEACGRVIRIIKEDENVLLFPSLQSSDTPITVARDVVHYDATCARGSRAEQLEPQEALECDMLGMLRTEAAAEARARDNKLKAMVRRIKAAGEEQLIVAKIELNIARREAVRYVAEVTSLSDDIAYCLLVGFLWEEQIALTVFFENPGRAWVRIDEVAQKLARLSAAKTLQRIWRGAAARKALALRRRKETKPSPVAADEAMPDSADNAQACICSCFLRERPEA
eukprot:s3139_g3.t3